MDRASAAPGHHHRLPGPLSPLVGRGETIAAARSALLADDVRLVTLLGPGGSGKTRIAIAVAELLIDQDELDIVFVDLTSAREATEVIPAVARAMDLTNERATSIDAIAAELDRTVDLLILDNLEQIAGIARPVSELLAASPRLLILATSRIALRLSVEQRFLIDPLPVPVGTELRALEANDAVQLFVRRARLIQPGFSLSPENAGAIADICRQVDGMPLGIELAAARIATLSPQALVALLTNRLAVLTNGPVDMSERHRTMHNAIAWSYELLDPLQQQAFRQLSLFPAGFELDMAEGVVGNGALDLVEQLLERSLLTRDPAHPELSRYRLFETIRAFGLTLLEQLEERAATLDRLANWIGSRFETIQAERQGNYTGEDLNRIDRDWPTFELVLERLNERGDHAALAFAIASLAPPLLTSGRARTILAWLDRALGRSDALPIELRAELNLNKAAAFHALGRHDEEPEILACAADLAERADNNVLRYRAAYEQGLLTYSQGNYPVAKGLFDRAIVLAARLKQPLRRTHAENVLAFLHADMHELDAAAAIYRRHAEETEASDDRNAHGIALGNLAGVTRVDSQALALYRESAELLLSCLDIDSYSQTLSELGVIEARTGSLDQAFEHIEHGITLAVEHDNRWAESVGRLSLGLARLETDHAATAVEPIRRSLTLAWTLGVRLGVAEALYALAWAHHALGDMSAAATLTGAADGVRQRMGLPVDPIRGKRAILQSLRSDRSLAVQVVAGQRLDDAGAVTLGLGEIQDAAGPSAPVTRAGDDMQLTARELDVLQQIARGKTNIEIGEALFISPFTAKTHVANLLGKLGLDNRAAAASWATARGLA